MEISFGQYKLALGKYGDALVAQSRARFDEAVDRGNVYAFADQAGAAIVAPATTTYVGAIVANRAGSGKKVKIWCASVTHTVVFAAVSGIGLRGGLNGASFAETTAATVFNLKTFDLSMPPGVFCGVAATVAAGTIIDILGAGLTGAVTTIPAMPALSKWYDGAIQVPEGRYLGFAGSAVFAAASGFGSFIIEVTDK